MLSASLVHAVGKPVKVQLSLEMIKQMRNIIGLKGTTSLAAVT